jgi:hypothetical protein
MRAAELAGRTALTAPVFTLIACQISADCYVDRF